MDFELRPLKSVDIFPMFNILSKIGLKNIRDSFSPDRIKKITSAVDSGENTEEIATMVGFSVIIDVIDIIMSNLPACQKEIFTFLSNISGMTVKEIENLDLGTFTELVIDVIQKEEFKDFFKAVSKLFN